ncbi:ketosteroid isomerase-related protein [Aurantimonas sp. VKM B-3413]|uniref:ketosteroid isomerase-related protein n=1 Tax=Aurantimonas sp. VKM B-3413 TaxID=2779401 RepID=UPI001E521906|nr:ketosteroid isomerase-related protein [Aurantimonas sp. VKM B-3413]MCB8837214.1 nuclear transport factor 2 family protein [Aurantimonas sp. VKM B-3413]
MTSRDETEALVGRYLAAFNASDWGGMLACLDEDVAHDLNEGGREIGREAFRDFLATMARHYRETLTDMVIMASADGTRAAAEFTVHGEYLATAEGLPEADGQRYSITAGQFFAIDDGRISRITTYYNLKSWIAAVSGR